MVIGYNSFFHMFIAHFVPKFVFISMLSGKKHKTAKHRKHGWEIS